MARTTYYGTDENEIGIDHLDGHHSIIEPLRRRVPENWAGRAAYWMDHAASRGFTEGFDAAKADLIEQVVSVKQLEVKSKNGWYAVYFDGKEIFNCRTRIGANWRARQFHKAKLAALTPVQRTFTEKV